MRTTKLIKRNLSYYWRTNVAVIFGVATAVAVLAGALVVGDSVRSSLRNLFLQRLGNTDYLVTAGFFRERLADDLQQHSEFASAGYTACPLIAIRGAVASEQGQRTVRDVRVYGIDERFWKFHQREQIHFGNREVLISESLAHELGSAPNDSLLLIIEKPSAIPVESLHGRKDEVGRTLRLTIRQTISPAALGEFSLQPQQNAVLAVFLPLSLLQKELDQNGKVNTILVAGPDPTSGIVGLEKVLSEQATLADFGIILRPITEQHSISLETDRKLIDDHLRQRAEAAAKQLTLTTRPVLSYLANSIQAGRRSIPYSLVTALDENTFAELRKSETPSGDLPPLILNEWAARDLGVTPGENVSLEYYLWHEAGRLETKTTQFQLVDVVPIRGIAADRDLVPEYPGITESEGLSDWDPPFPIDLGRVRKEDEDYWDQFRTTPKAFIPLVVGQELWQSRFGNLTALRIIPSSDAQLSNTLEHYSQALLQNLSPNVMGFQIIPVRAQGLEASRGSTDFGEYFLYFSFFLVVSALLLTVLFFKLGVEQRLREIGVLQALGFPSIKIRNLFLLEGTMLALLGSLVGLVGALAYGYLMMVGLRTWWVDAVGTTMLTLHIGAVSLIAGAAGGIIAALVCIVWTIRRLGKESTRSLLTGNVLETGVQGGVGLAMPGGKKGKRMVHGRAGHLATAFCVAGLALLIAAYFEVTGQVLGFFVGGTLLLVGLLFFQANWLKTDRRTAIVGNGLWSISRLGFRNSTYRPSRSILCITLIAFATFIIVAVDAFRRDTAAVLEDVKSGSGGYPLLAESLLPLVHDPNTADGRDALNLPSIDQDEELASINFVRFRLRPGDDASCLNLYQPRNPRIIAASDEFIDSNRFSFQGSLAERDEERENPWVLLRSEFNDEAVPVIGDANSLTYIMHLKVGDDLVLVQPGGTIRLRIVGALRDSIFQSELVMSEANFIRLFPEQEGQRIFLLDTRLRDQIPSIAAKLEERLSDYGFNVTTTAERLAEFHRVENTFISTFQILGGLGLLLGTVGMAAVLLRNVFERRKELALLRAVGYNSSHFTVMVIAENALLLICGLATGIICAGLAIAPVLIDRGARLPDAWLGLLLLAVLVTGLTASIIATVAALRSPLLPALRAE